MSNRPLRRLAWRKVSLFSKPNTSAIFHSAPSAAVKEKMVTIHGIWGLIVAAICKKSSSLSHQKLYVNPFLLEQQASFFLLL
jgi:hypothetical protein